MLDYREISIEDICDSAKYSDDEYVKYYEWFHSGRQQQESVKPMPNSTEDAFLQGFNQHYNLYSGLQFKKRR